MISKGSRIYSVKEIHEMCRDGFSDDLIEFYKRASESIRRILLSEAADEVRLELMEIKLMESEPVQVSDESQKKEALVINESAEEKDVSIAEEIIDPISEEENVESSVALVSCVEESLESNVMESIAKETVEESVEQESGAEDSMEIYPDAGSKENPDITIVASYTTEETESDVLEILAEKEESEVEEEPVNQSPYADKEFKSRLEVDELWLNITETQWCQLHGIPYQTIQVMVRFGGTKKYGVLSNCCPQCKRLYMNAQEYKEYLPIFRKKGIIYHIEEEIK